MEAFIPVVIAAVFAAAAGFAAAWFVRGAKLGPEIELAKARQADAEALLAAQRLLLTTPLPPETPPNPAWDPLLFQVAQSAAATCVTTTPPTTADPLSPPTLLLSAAPGMALPAHVHAVADAAEAVQWLTEGLNADSPPLASPSAWQGATEPAWDAAPLDAAPLGESLPPDPPLPPAEALRLLETRGNVPEVLRKRLLGQSSR